MCCNLSLGLMIKARACKDASQKWGPRVTFLAPMSVKECKGVWRNEPPHFQMSSHFGSSNPDGFSNLQIMNTRVKTHWIEKFLISLKISWKLDVWNGFIWLVWIFKTQVMAIRKARSKTTTLIPDHWKPWIALIYLCAGGMLHIVRKFAIRATTLI
jgi:hypothetical protein